jgi:hypothetical protein
MSTINGLPVHPLLVHAVVVLVPLSSVLLLLIAFWPAARQRLYLAAAVLSAVTLAFVPITTSAGDWLEHHLPRTPLIRAHTQIADYMLPWAIGLFVVTAVIAVREHLRNRAADETPGQGFGGRGVTVVLAVLALVAAVGATGVVYKIGDSGSRAAWTGNFSPTEVSRPPRQPAPNG